jgi:hypothetical protein
VEGELFFSIGFSEEKADELKDALMNVAKNGEIKSTIKTDFGVKYVVEGVISGPAGRRADIRTIWITETGQDRPRLITAYPL